MDEKTFRILQQEKWGQVGKRLLAIAINYARRYQSLGYQACDDIVQDVIDKALRGQRSWDPERGELFPWLIACVRSEIDNWAKKLATRNELPFLDQEDDQSETDLTLKYERPLSPEAIVLQKEQVDQIRQKIELIYEVINGDEALEEIVLAIDYLIDEHDSTYKPSRRDVASKLDISEQEYDNRMKRLRRRLSKMGLVK